jgi:hypothetical protein
MRRWSLGKRSRFNATGVGRMRKPRAVGGLIQAILGTTYTSELRRIIFGYSLWPCWTASLSIYGAVRFVSQAYRPSIYLRRKEVSATCYPTSFALTRS